MKKVQLIKQEVVYDEGKLIKYSTQFDNIFIYEVQLGWDYANNILSGQKVKQDPVYGETSVIVTYHDYIQPLGLCGEVEYIHYTKGLKSKYFVDYKIRKPNC
jgi:hypothetical protein